MAEPAAGNAREALHRPPGTAPLPPKSGSPPPGTRGLQEGDSRKGGGYLLSRIAAQYHRRGWA